ncbi:MAG: hypothetical protein QXJ72_06915 [Thermoproteota archaeon]
MVQTVLYNGIELIAKLFVKTFFWVKDLLERKKIRFLEKKKEKPEIKLRGWVFQPDEANNPSLIWHGGISVKIPISHIRPHVSEFTVTKKPSTRYFFTFHEVASKDFFRELELIAEKAGE